MHVDSTVGDPIVGGPSSEDLQSHMQYEFIPTLLRALLHYDLQCTPYVHGSQFLGDVYDRKVLRHRVGRVLHPEDLVQDEMALRGVILQPQVLHLDVPELPQTFSRCNALRRRTVRMQVHDDLHVVSEVLVQGLDAEAYTSGLGQSVILCLP